MGLFFITERRVSAIRCTLISATALDRQLAVLGSKLYCTQRLPGPFLVAQTTAGLHFYAYAGAIFHLSCPFSTVRITYYVVVICISDIRLSFYNFVLLRRIAPVTGTQFCASVARVAQSAATQDIAAWHRIERQTCQTRLLNNMRFFGIQLAIIG